MLLQTGDIRKTAVNNEAHAFRAAVPQHEKLLLLATLAVVAAWIMFRVALTLFATFG
jgi:hypothetical protein